MNNNNCLIIILIILLVLSSCKYLKSNKIEGMADTMSFYSVLYDRKPDILGELTNYYNELLDSFGDDYDENISEFKSFLLSNSLEFMQLKFQIDNTGNLIFKIKHWGEERIRSLFLIIIYLYLDYYGIDPVTENYRLEDDVNIEDEMKQFICDIFNSYFNNYSFLLSNTSYSELDPEEDIYVITDNIEDLPYVFNLDIIEEYMGRLETTDYDTSSLTSIIDVPGTNPTFELKMLVDGNDLVIAKFELEFELNSPFGATNTSNDYITVTNITTEVIENGYDDIIEKWEHLLMPTTEFKIHNIDNDDTEFYASIQKYNEAPTAPTAPNTSPNTGGNLSFSGSESSFTNTSSSSSSETNTATSSQTQIASTNQQGYSTSTAIGESHSLGQTEETPTQDIIPNPPLDNSNKNKDEEGGLSVFWIVIIIVCVVLAGVLGFQGCV